MYLNREFEATSVSRYFISRLNVDLELNLETGMEV